MPFALTTQEKKVLGFIAVMSVLGLAMLGIKKFTTGSGVVPASTAPAPSTQSPDERKQP